jgi:hypothetical protein
MGNESTSPEDIIAIQNYYPELHNNLEDDFRVLTLTGKQSGTKSIMLAPRKWWSIPETEREQIIQRAALLHSVADGMIDPVHLANAETRQAVAKPMVQITLGAIYLNLYYLLGAKVSPSASSPLVVFTTDRVAGVIVSSEDEMDSLMSEAVFENLAEKLEPELADRFVNDTALIKSVWQHVIFSALLAIERDYGPIQKIEQTEYDSLWDHYLNTEMNPAIFQACLFYAECKARDYLESINPSAWPVEELMEFLNLELASGGGFGIGSLSISRAQYKKLVGRASDSRSSSITVRYDVRDGKIVLRTDEIEIDATPIDIREMLTRRSRDYCWDHNQTRIFGEHYVKYLSFLENDAKPLLRKYPDKWREMLKPIDMNMPEGFYAYLPDLNSLGGYNASELALQIAACKTDPTYLEASKSKFADPDKTWPLASRSLFRRLPNKYKIKRGRQRASKLRKSVVKD